MAGGVGGVGGVVVADVVEVVVDGDVLRREGGSTARQSGVEGDGLVDDGSGGGPGEGERVRRLGDVDGDDAARDVAVRGVAVIGGAVVVCVRRRLVVAELVAAHRVRHVRRDVAPRGVVRGTL